MVAFGGATERLAWILDADPTKAVAGFKQVGDTAQKELGKADEAAKNSGRGLQVFGAGAVAFAAVAGKALFDFAGAAEESQAVAIRLQNSVENGGAKAGGSVKPYEDLAKSIELKTAADDEAVASGEALLIQFGLTQDQVLQLTPLVVDLSRKMGIDMDTAAKMVGKSVEGSSGALKKAGIIVDETAYKNDHFTATMDALRSKVGGFAEQEGATFAGRMERLGNEFHDLEEQVGVGVVKAFEHFADAAEAALGVLDHLSPELESQFGEYATYGTAVLGAAGALSFTIGTVERAIPRFASLATTLGLKKAATDADTVSTEANAVAQTEAAVAQEAQAAAAVGATTANEGLAVSEEEAGIAASGMLGPLGLAAAAAAAVGYALYQASQDAGGFSVDVKRALSDTDAEIDKSIAQLTKLGVSTAGVAKALAEQSIPAAERYADALDRNGQSSAEARAEIDKVKEAQIQEKATQEGVTAAVEDATQAYKEQTDALKAQFDPLFGMISAEKQVTKAQDDVTKANEAVYYAQVTYTEAVKAHGPASQEAKDAAEKLSTATQDLSDKNDAAVVAAEGFTAAALRLASGIADGSVQLDQAKNQLAEWVREGIITQQQADQMTLKFMQVADHSQIDGHVQFNTQEAQDNANALLWRLQVLQNQIHEFETSVVGGGQGLIGGHGFAVGTQNAPGGLAEVGEQGPEAVMLPSGSRVYPSVARESRNQGEPSGVTFNGPNYFGPDASDVRDELDWWVRTASLRGVAA